MSRILVLLTATWLFLSSGLSLAAEATPENSAENEALQSQADEQLDNETAQNELDEESDQGDGEAEEDSPSRFIPTEQISQDLGVSFPVDI